MILESIIDIPRKTYAKGVFDNADTENPKLKAGVIALIKSQIKKFEKKSPVLKYSLIGSILTKRYREDADLDVNVLFDVEPSYRETMRQQLASDLRKINGKLIPGTKHPINYYVITDPKIKEKNDREADGVFDIDANKFSRKPKPITFEPKDYEANFRKKVEEIDVVKGELVRDIVDYKELSQLTKDDVDGIQKLVSNKIKEIEESLKILVNIGDEMIKQRQNAFAKNMTPDEIRKFGIKNKLPKNVIYKMMEKYHYSKLYKKCKDILDDGRVTDAEIKSMTEANKGSVVFAWGRFNPPTIGHEKLLDKLARVSANEMRVYISKSNDPQKNPLNPRQKLDYMKKIFPRYARKIMIPRTNIVIDIITDLYKEGYTNLKMVAGSDRVQEFKKLFTTYNDVKSRHGYYNFDSIEIINAGERDPDADGATGMSASKMRSAAKDNDLKSFEKGLPNFRDVEKLFKDVRRGMNLSASYMNGMGHNNYRPVASLEQFEQQQIRDMYIREMLFNVGDIVENVNIDIQGTVTRRGTNYVVLEDNNHNLHKSWIWDCIPVPPDREVEVREHNLNIDYGFKTVREEDMNEESLNEKRAKQAVNSRGKVQRYVTAHNLKFKGKQYKEIDMELVKINNSTEMVTFKIIGPKELFGNETNISFKALKRGPFMATNIPNAFEVLDKNADMNEDMDRQPQDKDVKKVKGTQPKKYFKGISKDAKMKRAKYFAKKSKLHHSDPERYSGKRPGDSDDAKPSKPADATIKVRKMLKKKGFEEFKNEIAPIKEGSLEDVTKRLKAKKIRVKTITRTMDKVTHLYVHVNDVDDAQQILKNDPLYIAGKLRVVAKEEVQNEACWDGYKAVGMKNKGGKQVPNCVPEEMSTDEAKKVEGYVPESYEEGEDYANHTKEVTPGEKANKKPMDSKKRTPENRITAEDVKEWALQDETIDKYKGRYKEEWKSKLVEVTKKMMSRVNEDI